MLNNRIRNRSQKYAGILGYACPAASLLVPAGAAGMLQARPGPQRASASKSRSFPIRCDYYTPGTQTTAPHAPLKDHFTPTPGPEASPRQQAPAHTKSCYLQVGVVTAAKSPPTKHPSVTYVFFPAQAAPSSFNSSASGDPHSHASPALFATSTLLMQHVPCTERQPHRLVICKLPPTLFPDVTALGIVSYLT